MNTNNNNTNTKSSLFIRKPLPRPKLGDDFDGNPDDHREHGHLENVVVRYGSSFDAPMTHNEGEQRGGTSNNRSQHYHYEALPLEQRSHDEVQNDGDHHHRHETHHTVPNNQQPQQQVQLQRHISLLELIAFNVGTTIGSGLFAVSGLVAREYAGPAATLSWAIAGLAALLSGACYAELASRIPLPGTAYAFTFVALGELPAVFAAACLSAEFIMAPAAVARSWADKVMAWLEEDFGNETWMIQYADWWSGNNSTRSPLAFVISSALLLLLLNGAKESKRAMSIFTAVKVFIVVFMMVAGMFYVQPSNWNPFVPAQMGWAGIFQGSTATFFGYLGFDQVTCLAGEVKNPKRTIPLAVIYTLVAVCFVYMLATLILTGMQPYTDLSTVSGFPVAFYSVGSQWSGQITALGEIATLPVTALVVMMVQPRLQYALAEDGLLPAFFGVIDQHGNLWNGILVSGIVVVAMATFVPFEHLNDMVSCSVLLALSCSSSSLIVLWHEGRKPESGLAEWLLLTFHICAALAAFTLTNYLGNIIGVIVAVLSIEGMILTCLGIWYLCPRTAAFGGTRQHYHGNQLLTDNDDGYFRTPFVPFLPCLAIFINWFLIAQLAWTGILGQCGVIFMALIYYFAYAKNHSVVQNEYFGRENMSPATPGLPHELSSLRGDPLSTVIPSS